MNWPLERTRVETPSKAHDEEEPSHMPVPTIELNNELQIPQLGFGVFLVPPDETTATLKNAIELGYRHIDTAQMYRNEHEVGSAIRQSGLHRAEFFITSKLNNNRIGFDAALSGFDETMAALQLEVLDLFLIHWPLATVRDFTDTWRAFERIYRDGRVRAIGVSNFQIAHLQRLFDECEVTPAVNQIEVHPYLTQTRLIDFCHLHEIGVEAWSPIGRGAVLADHTLAAIGRDVNRSPAQVVLRWHVQLGNIVFPKASSITHMRENFQIFDFELTLEQMAAISALNKDERVGPDPDVFAFVPQ